MTRQDLDALRQARQRLDRLDREMQSIRASADGIGGNAYSGGGASGGERIPKPQLFVERTERLETKRAACADEYKRLHRLVMGACKDLTTIERRLVALRFGKAMSWHDVNTALGISRAKSCRLMGKILEKVTQKC